jgi:hypothetical protein
MKMSKMIFRLLISFSFVTQLSVFYLFNSHQSPAKQARVGPTDPMGAAPVAAMPAQQGAWVSLK